MERVRKKPRENALPRISLEAALNVKSIRTAWPNRGGKKLLSQLAGKCALISAQASLEKIEGVQRVRIPFPCMLKCGPQPQWY